MKRKFLSLLLIFMLLPFASLFVGCGKDGYNLNNLQNDFNEIKTQNENIRYENGKLLFDYSEHARLYIVIQSVYPYTQLNELNQVYENVMAFAFNYIDECSNNSAVKDATIKNKVKDDLNALKEAVNDVDVYVTMLAEIINVSHDVMLDACVSSLSNLIYSYDELYRTAMNFNNSLADLYFNHILSNSNPNIYNQKIEDFDVNIVVNNFDARLKYQISNLSQCFIEMYFDGEKLSQEIVEGINIFDLSESDYESNVENINIVYNSLVAAEKAINNKQSFYDLSVQAYNAQEALNNDISKFIYAYNHISYANFDAVEATANEKICALIIDERFELVSVYNDVLVQILEITGV